jgi:pseudaminic acid synthase
MTSVKIGKNTIGLGALPFIVAEMSGNHNQSLEKALEIVKAAASSGVQALKIQTYTPDTMTLNLNSGDFLIEDKNSLWCGRTLYDLYGEAYTPWEWHQPIFDCAKAHGIIPFSTPFDNTAVDYLEDMGVLCYKIASFENTDLPLIRYTASTGKPVIISTGMATEDEIAEAVTTARDAGCKEIVLLKCTSSYPASAANANLATIEDMRKKYACEVGLSDHTMGIGVAVAAVSFGASFIEKHFTVSRSEGGVDSAFSMEPQEMSALVQESRKAFNAIGQVQYGPSDAEIPSLAFRRSLYIVEDLKEGDVLTSSNVRSIRPGAGLAPKYIDNVLGKTVVKDVEKGTALNWDLLQ